MSNEYIISKIDQAIKDFKSKSPTMIYFTKSDEIDLLDAMETFPDELKSSIIQNGIRKAFENENNKIFGMTISWDANEFKVE